MSAPSPSPSPEEQRQHQQRRFAKGGSWPSPITSDLITKGSKALSEPCYGGSASPGAGRVLYWLESRPSERGRTVVVARVPPRSPSEGAAVVDVTPPMPPPDGDGGGAPFFNVRTRVHEYGGGALCVIPGGSAGEGGEGSPGDLVLFSNFADQRLYVQRVVVDEATRSLVATPPRALTPNAGNSELRFADAEPDPLAPRERVFVVLEDHRSAPSPNEPENCIAAVSLVDGTFEKVVRGNDFYSSPRPSPDGRELAWVEWRHPNMPWDDTALFVAGLERREGDGFPVSVGSSRRLVAGGEGNGVSAMEPTWFSPGGGAGERARLAFISDETGWWNAYAESPSDGGGGTAAVNLYRDRSEFAGPAWGMGSRPLRSFEAGGSGSSRLVLRRSNPEESASQIVVLDPGSPGAAPLTLDTVPFTEFGRIAVGGGGGEPLRLAVVASQPTAPAALVEAELVLPPSPRPSPSTVPVEWSVVARSSDLDIAGYVSTPRVVKFPTGSGGGESAFANYYAPESKDHALFPGELPPLIVKIHGGPTGRAPAAFSLGVAFWTSRGFAVADVNYRGSSGYGRSFRKALDGAWGVADVEDVCRAARHLSETEGVVDRDKLVVTGGSAGGFTVLAALAFEDVFACGASHYGVADLALLAADTHKFESNYLFGLVGPCPDPKNPPPVYVSRSPIHHLDSIRAPLVLFQGEEDKVVPPEQATLMYSRLRERGLPTALKMFPGEQHGFRSRDAIRSALEGELWFYGKILGFEPSLPEDVGSLGLPELVNYVRGGIGGPDVEVE